MDSPSTAGTESDGARSGRDGEVSHRAWFRQWRHTACTWAKRVGTTGTIAGKWGTQNSYRLLLSSGKYAFSVTLSTGTVVTATATALGSTTDFSHVAGVFNGSKAILYVNGTQAASATASGTLKSSTDPIRVGNTTNNANYYQGSVDELRLYNSALSPAQVNRLANGLQHRRLRAVAVDPKFVTDPTYAGKRLHEHPTLAGAGWRTPDAVVQWWAEFLNAAAGERVYLPEDGSYVNAVKYLEEVPWNENAKPDCNIARGTSPVTQTADQYLAQYVASGTGNPAGKTSDPFRMFAAYNSSLTFNLVQDANVQRFHELMVITPPDWGIMGEGAMAAGTDDAKAYPTHDTVFRIAGLDPENKFIFHGVSFKDDYRNWEQYWHRTEAILLTTWASDLGNGCSYPGNLGYGTISSLSGLRSAADLFMLNDGEYANQAHVGVAHYTPNSTVGYIRSDRGRTPSAYSYWASFPDGFPFDLTRNDRRVPVSSADWACPLDSNFEGACAREAFVWQLSKLPKAEGFTDGRNNNWWMYVTDPNYQVGRGSPTTSPVVGPTHGGMDFTLTIYPNRIGLKWMPEATSKGSYTVQSSTDRSTWSLVGTTNGATGTYDVTSLPPAGTDTYYRVAWYDGTTTRYSDMLGVNLGSATLVNVSGGQRPPINPSISLLQQGNPYVRWELPSTCGDALSKTVAHSPCNTNTNMKCVANECRANPNGDGQLYSDYHPAVTRYLLEKRSGTSSFSSVWTVDRRPGWDGQFNHLRFSSADNTVAANTPVGYRVSAYQLNGGTQGAEWGHTDVLLAVPGNATVGTTGSGGTGGTGGTSSTGGAASGGKATGGTVPGSGGTTSTGGKASATGGTATSTGGKASATGGTAASTGGTSSSTGGSSGSGTNPCAGLCSNPVVFTTANYQSGNLGTDAICRETTANLSGGNCSNMSSRTLTVNSTTMSCNGWSLPAKRNGGYCIQVTAGTPSWASFSTW
jgi:hypothetical protein